MHGKNSEESDKNNSVGKKKKKTVEEQSPLRRQIQQFGKETLKEIRAGFEPITSAILVQCSTKWD